MSWLTTSSSFTPDSKSALASAREILLGFGEDDLRRQIAAIRDGFAPDEAEIARLAGALPPDETQLLYSLCLHGRAELGLGDDDGLFFAAGKAEAAAKLADLEAASTITDPDALARKRAVIEAALSYPEESAGRLMSRDFVAVPEHMTVGDLIDFLREGRDLANEFWEVFIVDARHHPVGTCALSWILRCPRSIARWLVVVHVTPCRSPTR